MMYRVLVVFFIMICLLSCNKIENPNSELINLRFKRVLILGNSITYHEPNISLNWSGNWGMAASARDSDYVHILNTNFINNKSNSVFKAVNISVFENEYQNYDLSRLDSLNDFKPDLLIIRIGENVNPNNYKTNNFSKYYIDLIRLFKNKNQNLKVICVSNFWRNPPIEETIKQCAIAEQAAYVSISHLDEAKFTAWGLFSEPAVGSHPGNRGMKEIANLIWTKIIELNK